MVHAYYTKYNQEYAVQECTVLDIDEHYNIVRSLVDDIDEDVYKANMLKSVECSMANKVVDSDNILLGFIYTYMQDGKAYGSAIWGNNNISAFVCLLRESFYVGYPYHCVYIEPHKGNVAYLRSLVEGYSIRNNHNNSGPLIIRIDTINSKIKDVYLKLGITNG